MDFIVGLLLLALQILLGFHAGKHMEEGVGWLLMALSFVVGFFGWTMILSYFFN